MKDRDTITHESFGMLDIGRYSGGKSSMFGSAIEHSGGISIKIKRADWDRSFSHDHFYGRENLIEVRMSFNQFAEAITSGMNTSGTPCTIAYVDGKKMEDYHFVNQRQEFKNDYKETMKDLTQEMMESVRQATSILASSKPPNKKEKEVILAQLAKLKMNLEQNLPYMNTIFNEAMNKTVVEAKSEIDGFYESKIRSIGIKAIEELNLTKPKMLEE